MCVLLPLPLTLSECQAVAISCADVNDHLSLQCLDDCWGVLPRLCGATPHSTAIAAREHLRKKTLHFFTLHMLIIYMILYAVLRLLYT